MAAAYRVVFLLMLLALRMGRADKVLNHILQRDNMYKNSTKLWFKYISRLCIHILGYVDKYLTNNKIYKYFSKYSKHILEDDNIGGPTKADKFAEVVDNAVKRATGYSNYQDKREIIYDYGFQDELRDYLAEVVRGAHEYYKFNGWFFSLDVHLSLNITFTHISIPVRTCSTERIMIYDPWDPVPFIYCHFVPHFSLFPTFNNVYVHLVEESRFRPTRIQVVFYFSAMDSNFINNYVINDNYFGNLMYKYSNLIANGRVSGLILQRKSKLDLYLITLNKFSQVNVRMNSISTTEVFVFDGPSLVVEELKPNKNNIYKTSTFQCLVYVHQSIETKNTFNYSSILMKFLPPQEVKGPAESLNLKIPGSICTHPSCAIPVIARTNAHINVTVTKMDLKGPPSFFCKYAGVSIVESIKNNHKEIATLCEQYDTSNSQGRSLYSQTSKAILIVYWYKGFSEIAVSLNISLTRCKPISLDPCRLNELCHILTNTPGLCHTYLSQLTSLLNVKLTTEHFLRLSESKLKYIGISLSVGNVSCVVIQINQGRDPKFLFDEKCKLKLLPMKVLPEMFVSKSILRGAMLSSSVVLDCIRFAGIVEIACVYNTMNLRANCESQVDLREMTESVIHRSDSWSFFIASNFEADTFHDVSLLENVIFIGWSYSWAEVIFWLSGIVLTSKRNQNSISEYMISVIPQTENIVKVHVQPRRDYTLILNMSVPGHVEVKSIMVLLNITLSLSTPFDTASSAADSYKYSIGEKSLKDFENKVGLLNEMLYSPAFVLSKGRFMHSISVPGVFNHTYVKYKCCRQSDLTDHTLRATWIIDKFQKSKAFARKSAKKCGNMSQKETYSYCLNFSSHRESYKLGYYLFLGKTFMLHNHSHFHQNFVHYFQETQVYVPTDVEYKPQTRSWRNAYKLCEDFGGTLPIFHSKDELEELLALLKLHKDMYPVEALYIGLHYNYSRESWKWMPNDHPVSYQLFSNSYFGKKYFSSYQLNHSKLFTEYANLSLNQRKKASSEIYPSMLRHNTCTMMLLTNLALADWVPINCSERILGDVMCFVPHHPNSSSEISYKHDSKMCHLSQVMKSNMCYSVLWIHNINDFVPANSNNISNLTTLNSLAFILDATESKLSPIASLGSKTSQVNIFRFDTMLQTYTHDIIKLSTFSGGFQISISSMVEIQVGSNAFLCKGGAYISSVHVCDGVVDCPNDGSNDEDFCTCASVTETSLTTCKTIVTSEGKTFCSLLYYTSKDGSCSMFSRISEDPKELKIKSFDCKNGLHIHGTLVDDLVVDCGDNPLDEEHLLSLLKHGKQFRCFNPNQIPCKSGHSKCYDISQICAFKMNKYNHLIPCRNGEHLQNCKAYECNAMFKCPGYYCIPFGYVCDGKWDCPYGTDEKNMCVEWNRCFQKFKCKNTGHTCIHVGDLCDGEKDCPHGEDELLCELQHIPCPNSCQCLALALFCAKNLVFFSRENYPYLSVSLLYVELHPRKILQYFRTVLVLKLIGLSLTDICHKIHSHTLTDFSAEFNPFTRIRKHCLSSSHKLAHVSMAHNNITSLEAFSFNNLSKLYLNLSNNYITHLPANFISTEVKILVLSIENNPLFTFSENPFQNLILGSLETTDFHTCCFVSKETKCSASKPWYFSCSSLLFKSAITKTFIVTSICVIILNICSALLHVISRRRNRSFSALVVAINTNDIICGMHLCMIWTIHFTSKDMFAVREMVWRSSVPCFALYGLELGFNILSPVLLSFFAVCRLMVVIFPVDTKFKQLTFILKCVAFLYLCAFCISFLTTFLFRLTYNAVPNYLCSPFVDYENSNRLVEIVAGLIAAVQALSLLILTTAHVLLVKEVKNSQEIVNKCRTTRNSNFSLIVHLATQLVVLTISTAICWLPMMTTHIVISFLSTYSLEFILWKATLIEPINSLVYPEVFIVTQIRRIRGVSKSNVDMYFTGSRSLAARASAQNTKHQ